MPDYLGAAVTFANERLAGNLCAMLLLDPRTTRKHRAAVEGAIDDLRYGTVGVNEGPNWGVVSGYGPWGGHPGNTPEDVKSGIGFIGNALLLDAPEKTVVRAAFRPLLKPATDATHRHLETISAGFLRLRGNDDVRGLPSVMLGVLRG